MWKTVSVIAGLVVLLAVPANAQSVSLGPQAGYYKAGDADGSWMGGFAWRFGFTRNLGLEASINYRQETYGDDLLTIKSWPVMVSGLVYPLPIVYGALGAGWYNSTYDYNQSKWPSLAPEDKTTQEFGWHFGGGVELPVASKFLVTGDVRYVFLDYDFTELPGSNDLKSDFYVVTVGLLFRL